MVRQSDSGRKLQDKNLKIPFPGNQAEICILVEPGNYRFLSKDNTTMKGSELLVTSRSITGPQGTQILLSVLGIELCFWG